MIVKDNIENNVNLEILKAVNDLTKGINKANDNTDKLIKKIAKPEKIVKIVPTKKDINNKNDEVNINSQFDEMTKARDTKLKSDAMRPAISVNNWLSSWK